MNLLMNNWRCATEWQDSNRCALKTSSKLTSPKACRDTQLCRPFRVCHSGRGAIARGSYRDPQLSSLPPSWPSTDRVAHQTRNPPSPQPGSGNTALPGRGSCSRWDDDLQTSRRALFWSELAALKGFRKCLPCSGMGRDTPSLANAAFFLSITPWTNPKSAKAYEWIVKAHQYHLLRLAMGKFTWGPWPGSRGTIPAPAQGGEPWTFPLEPEVHPRPPPWLLMIPYMGEETLVK